MQFDCARRKERSATVCPLLSGKFVHFLQLHRHVCKCYEAVSLFYVPVLCACGLQHESQITKCELAAFVSILSLVVHSAAAYGDGICIHPGNNLSVVVGCCSTTPVRLLFGVFFLLWTLAFEFQTDVKGKWNVCKCSAFAKFLNVLSC